CFRAPRTPGRKILEEGIFEDGNTKVNVKSRVEWFDFSSHIDRKGIIETVKEILGIEKIILVHGEYEGQTSLANEIKEKTGIEVIIPSNGDEIVLD
ncbi:MAG: MBL fold metallo-hydrolase RNA specificity domain-containing protein, partial [Caldisphaera sp.]|nr:MBL fold metallo-hydrolase RNA specificity domain-containing protein [Caldisphaera sp.]